VLLETREGNREDPPQMIFMLKQRAWSAEETERMAAWPGVQPVIVPGRHVEEPYASLFSGRTSVADYVAHANARVDAVYDDRPFFFARAKPWGLPKAMRQAFLRILVPVLALSVLFLFVGKPKGAAVGPYAASVLYFASLGIGFIAVELTLLQHLTLLLGHPIFTLAILLFTLLAAGGLGSAVSALVPPRGACLVAAALGTLALGLAYRRRIVQEERVLLTWLSGYAGYVARTGALVPRVRRRRGPETVAPALGGDAASDGAGRG